MNRRIAAVIGTTIAVAGLAVAIPLTAGAGPSGSTATSATTSSSPTPLRASQAGAPAPSRATFCGTGFFDQTSESELTRQFGLRFNCFSLAGSEQWIVIFAGQTSTPADRAPFGSYVVAIDQCDSFDVTCENPDSPHSITEFKFYSPPEPAVLANPTDFQTAFGNNVLMLRDGSCGVVLFDTMSGDWYEVTTPKNPYTAAEEADSLTAGSVSNTTAFPAQPQPMSGGTALTSSVKDVQTTAPPPPPNQSAAAQASPTSCPA